MLVFFVLGSMSRLSSCCMQQPDIVSPHFPLTGSVFFQSTFFVFYLQESKQIMTALFCLALRTEVQTPRFLLKRVFRIASVEVHLHE